MHSDKCPFCKYSNKRLWTPKEREALALRKAIRKQANRIANEIIARVSERMPDL